MTPNPKKIKEAAVKAKKSATKAAQDLKENVGEKLDEAKIQSEKAAIEATQGLIDLHKKTFDSAFKILAKLQGHSERLLTDIVGGADWMPSEGKELVDEWVETLRNGRKHFQKSMDKSFGLASSFLSRVESERVTDKKPAAKKSASKQSAAKKPTAKKSVAKKPAAKKPAAKKPAAKKKSSASVKTAE